MMGGLLEASLEKDFAIGSVSASIHILMDALINFSPFHYDLTVGVDAGVKATLGWGWFSKHIDGHFHFDMHLWGPDFSGTAHIDIGPKAFEVEFGAASSVRALPISWTEFKEKFLQTPKDAGAIINNSKVCTATVTKGLLQKATKDSKEIYVVDAKTLEIEVKSLIPLEGDKIGIAPMNILSDVSTKLEIGDDSLFNRKNLTDSVPKAIWGTQGLHLDNALSGANMLVQGVKTGVKLTAKPDQETVPTKSIDKRIFAYNTDEFTLEDMSTSLKMKAVNSPATFQRAKNSFQNYTGMDLDSLQTLDAQSLLNQQLLACTPA